MCDTIADLKETWETTHRGQADNYGADIPWGKQWGRQKLINLVAGWVREYVEGKTVFEIGCGGGKWTRMLFDVGATRVIATDIHQFALDQSCEYEPRAEYILGDGESLPVEGDFDLVFSYGVFLHLPPGLVCKYLQEAHRIARSVIFSLPILDLPKARERFVRRIDHRAYANPYKGGYANFYTNDYIQHLLSMSGWNGHPLGNTLRDATWIGYKGV